MAELSVLLRGNAVSKYRALVNPSYRKAKVLPVKTELSDVTQPVRATEVTCKASRRVLFHGYKIRHAKLKLHFPVGAQ
jgi:hypothetical protein